MDKLIEKLNREFDDYEARLFTLEKVRFLTTLMRLQ